MTAWTGDLDTTRVGVVYDCRLCGLNDTFTQSKKLYNSSLSIATIIVKEILKHNA